MLAWRTAAGLRVSVFCFLVFCFVLSGEDGVAPQVYVTSPDDAPKNTFWRKMTLNSSWIVFSVYFEVKSERVSL